MGGVLHTFEDTNGGGVIVDATSGTESGGADGGRGDKIVGECVVQVSLDNCFSGLLIHIPNVGLNGIWWKSYLQLKHILHIIEFLLESVSSSARITTLSLMIAGFGIVILKLNFQDDRPSRLNLDMARPLPFHPLPGREFLEGFFAMLVGHPLHTAAKGIGRLDSDGWRRPHGREFPND